MIILPNSFERYLTSLRVLTAFRISKHGIRPNYMKNLKKIYTAEAFYYQKAKQIVDIENHCKNLFYAISAYNPNLQFCLYCKQNCLINKELLNLVILNICRFADFLKIQTDDMYLYLTFNNSAKNIYSFVKAMNGNMYFETKTKTSLLVIPAPETKDKAIPFRSEWEWLFDEFSVVNLFYK